VLPSVAEIGNGASTGTWGISYTGATDNKRGFGYDWWLRSPGGAGGGIAAFVDSDGGVGAPGDYVDTSSAVRPAFKLNLASVIFTSDASGASAKSAATAGSGLVGATAPTAGVPVKLTVEDSSLTLASVTQTGYDSATRTVSFSYTGATPGMTLSTIVTDSSGALRYYGKLLASIDASGSGTASLVLPSDLNPTDVVQVFVEKANGDYYTDFASTPLILPLDLDGPVLSNGSAIRSSDQFATVSFTSDEAGTYYWQLDGTAPADAAALVNGGALVPRGDLAAGVNTKNFAGMTAGAHTLYLAAKDTTEPVAGNIGNLLVIQIPAYAPPPAAPTITSAASFSATAGTGGTFQVTATGTPAPTFALSGTVPTGVSINTTTGLITVAPAVAAGTYSFAITASNGTAPDDTQTFSLKVATTHPVLRHFGTYSGSGTVWAQIDADFSTFDLLLTDSSNVVHTMHYTPSAGSTVITLSESYLKTLPNGTYYFYTEHSTGTSELIQLIVNVQGSSAGTPATGDNLNLLALGAALLAFVCGTASLLVWRKRQYER